MFLDDSVSTRDGFYCRETLASPSLSNKNFTQAEKLKMDMKH